MWVKDVRGAAITYIFYILYTLLGAEMAGTNRSLSGAFDRLRLPVSLTWTWTWS